MGKDYYGRLLTDNRRLITNKEVYFFMSNLTTRKIVLGLLMVLVLAFSVQGIADAVEFGVATGDLQTIIVESDIFTITVPVTLNDDATAITDNGNDVDEKGNLINSSGYKIVKIGNDDFRISAAARNVRGFRRAVSGETGDQSATGRYVSDSSTDTAADVVDSQGRQIFTERDGFTPSTAVPDAPVPPAQQYHFNEEAIRIDIPSGITLTAPVRSTSDVTLTETVEIADSRNLGRYILDNSITVTGFATSTGKKTISIIDSTPSSDRPGDAEETLTFTVYVVRLRKDISSTTSIRLAGVTNGVGVGYYGRSPEQIYRGDSSHYPVTYTVTGGTIYAQETVDRKTGDVTTSLVTSSAAKVYMLMGSNTTRVDCTGYGSGSKQYNIGCLYLWVPYAGCKE